jgi:cell shape-determining protein MreD
MYSWICHDSSRFRPVWLLIFGLFYDFLKDGIVGITPLFFIILYHLEQKKTGLLLSFDFKETWIKFIIFLIAYSLILLSLDSFFENSSYDFRKNIISFVFTIILFPFFFSLIRKLTVRFGNYDN